MSNLIACKSQVNYVCNCNITKWVSLQIKEVQKRAQDYPELELEVISGVLKHQFSKDCLEHCDISNNTRGIRIS